MNKNNFIGINKDIIEITSGYSANLLLERSGNTNLKVCIPLSFDIGDLKELESFKRLELKKYVDINDEDCSFVDEFNILKDYVEKASKIRVWSSLFDADEYCLLLFICYHFKDKNISVVFANEGNIHANVITCHDENEIQVLEKKEHLLKKYEKEEFANEWKKIIDSNKPLRYMINGYLQSVNIDYFDSYILKRLNELGEVTKTKLVADLIANPIIPGFRYSSFIYEYLINELIRKKLIIENDNIIKIK